MAKAEFPQNGFKRGAIGQVSSNYLLELGDTELAEGMRPGFRHFPSFRFNSHTLLGAFRYISHKQDTEPPPLTQMGAQKNQAEAAYRSHAKPEGQAPPPRAVPRDIGHGKLPVFHRRETVHANAIRQDYRGAGGG